MSKLYINPDNIRYRPETEEFIRNLRQTEQPVGQFSELLTGVGQGLVSSADSLAYLSRAMFGDEYGRGINEWANKYNQNTAPTNYNKEDASLLDYIPFVSNMYTSGEASRQVGNLVGQLAPDIAAVALTGGASLAVTGASLTARGAAVGLAKDAVKDLVKKHGYKEAVENIAQQEIAKGVSSGALSSAITGARGGVKGTGVVKGTGLSTTLFVFKQTKLGVTNPASSALDYAIIIADGVNGTGSLTTSFVFK